MLTFQPAFDPFHAIFRLLRLLPVFLSCEPVEREKARILDFYLAFPFLVGAIGFKRGHSGFRKVAKNYDHLRPYGGIPDDRELLLRMAPAQNMAAETLVSRGIVNPDAYARGYILPGDVVPPEDLALRTEQLNIEQDDLIALLRTLCADYPLLGADGLKQRTGLLEHRYDAV